MDLELADIKPNLLNILIILLVVIAFIPILKTLAAKYPDNGISDLILAV